MSKKSDKMRKLMAQAPEKSAKKEKKPKVQKSAADVNQDGKVDEKDLSLVEKAIKAVSKRVRKKKD